MKFKFEKTIRGLKCYGIMRQDMFDNCEIPICINGKQGAIKLLDDKYTILVELEITKAYTRNPEFVEIILN